MSEYKILNKQFYSNKDFSIVPIRFEDRYLIMKWRNEQLYHLRQNNPLNRKTQDNYFRTVINNLFDQEKPDQLLFSYLKREKCIGYGGLVHINWINKNAEISFIMNTSLEETLFEFHWSTFLGLIEKLAFEELKLHKIYVYAFNLRPLLYSTLINNNYFLDATLKEHCFFNEKYIDVVIHSKIK